MGGNPRGSGEDVNESSSADCSMIFFALPPYGRIHHMATSFTTTLYLPSVPGRGYPEKKIQENITAEILQTILVEAQESYAAEIVVELRSEGLVDGEMEGNVDRVLEWVKGWKRDGAGEGHVLRGGERQEEEEEDGEDEMED